MPCRHAEQVMSKSRNKGRLIIKKISQRSKQERVLSRWEKVSWIHGLHLVYG